MKKMRTLLPLLTMLALMALCMTGCAGGEFTMTTQDNAEFATSRFIGWNENIVRGSYDIYGHKYSVVSEESWPALEGWNYGGYNKFNKLLTFSSFGPEVQVAEIVITPAYKPGSNALVSENGVYDIAMRIRVPDGLTPEDLYELSPSYTQMYLKDDVQRYQNGDAATKDEIIDKWFPQARFTVNFAAPVSVQEGSQWAAVDGKKLTVNVGQMMLDGGGDVLVLSSNHDFDYDAEENVERALNGGVITEEPTEPESVSKQFTDVAAGAWYEPAVQYCVDKGIMSGYGNGKFGPNDQVTFAQLCKIMMNNGSYGEDAFEDHGLDHWANAAVGWAAYHDLVLDDDIMTNGRITVAQIDKGMNREQAMYSLARYAGYRNEHPSESVPKIPDLMSISYKYRDTIKLAYQYGITNGVDGIHTFSPGSPVTRAQVCQVMCTMGW